jgi:hypothetical protein
VREPQTGDFKWSSGMFEFDKFFTIEQQNDELFAEVDFYSQTRSPLKRFNMDTWEKSKLIIRAPATKHYFYLVYKVTRLLLTGGIVRYIGGSYSRHKHLKQVAKLKKYERIEWQFNESNEKLRRTA